MWPVNTTRTAAQLCLWSSLDDDGDLGYLWHSREIYTHCLSITHVERIIYVLCCDMFVIKIWFGLSSKKWLGFKNDNGFS